MTILSENIKLYRKQMGWSQKELAQKLEVAPTAVSAWEVGRNQPLMDKIEMMSSLFNIKKSELLGDVRNQEPDLEELLDGVMLFGGKPLSDTDKSAIRGIISGYMNSKGE